MRFHTIQPSLFPEYDFAVVHTYRDVGLSDYYRPECWSCQWMGWNTTNRASAERDARNHDADGHEHH